jgi:hypothetical protein
MIRPVSTSKFMTAGTTPPTETTLQLEFIGRRNSTAHGSITMASAEPEVFFILIESQLAIHNPEIAINIYQLNRPVLAEPGRWRSG